MMQEAEELAARHANFKFVPVLSDAAPEDCWSGASGFVHAAVMKDIPDLSRWQVYACGSPLMVEAASRDFTQRCGLPEIEFFADSFVSLADLARSARLSAEY